MTNELDNKEDVQISVERICASILDTIGEVGVSLENLMKDYSKMNIAINQDPENQTILFSLVEIPEGTEAEI